MVPRGMHDVELLLVLERTRCRHVNALALDCGKEELGGIAAVEGVDEVPFALRDSHWVGERHQAEEFERGGELWASG